MMRSISVAALFGALCISAAAWSDDIPPNNVVSDSMENTAMGSGAMGVSTSGSDNTAAGAEALDSDFQGSFNTAVGTSALTANGTGDGNTAVGYEALLLDQANYNTALGYQSLENNTNGNHNVASGIDALFHNVNGSFNTGTGANALLSNQHGNENTATGYSALQKTTGTNNTALGWQAGINLTTGSNNIEIGNAGVSSDADTIRIGTSGTHKTTIISGIAANPLSANGSPVAVFVSSTGQLGIAPSAERFKTDITPLGDRTAEKLQQLRPVSFRLKADPEHVQQYGLIAEEVDKVYPELVVRDGAGKIQGIRYDQLTPMLLNEVQQLRHQSVVQQQQLAELMQQNRAIQAKLSSLRGQ
jgi:trimeric autotransporter adhesin